MKLILGDCLEKLKDLPDNSIDSIVTDPPYGLSFMNKKWDYDVPSTDIWVECLRVLKPGGHLLSFSGSRTYHRMVVRIEDAGFEIRDQIMWVYGSGFPKGKSQLKPAHEPIVLARKPLSEKTVELNVLKWGTGGINIDECRIEYKGDKPNQLKEVKDFNSTGIYSDMKRTEDWEPNNTGRWPANIIFDEGDEPWKRYFYCPKTSRKDRDEGLNEFPDFLRYADTGQHNHTLSHRMKPDTVFKNSHPTVKPTALMEYLIKLVTPKGGTVMDCFLGSGSTGKAAVRNGFDFIGI